MGDRVVRASSYRGRNRLADTYNKSKDVKLIANVSADQSAAAFCASAQHARENSAAQC